MNSITLEQAYYIAELAGVVLIIFSLIYVGKQLKQNTCATKAAASQAFVQMYNTFTSDLAMSQEIATIWHKGLTDFDSLDPVETIRFSAALAQLFRAAHCTYLQWQDGTLADDIWMGFYLALRDMLSHPGVLAWWRYREEWYGVEFRELVNRELVASHQARSAYPHMSQARHPA